MKKTIVLLCALFLVLATIPMAQAQSKTTTFRDVPANHWASKSIKQAAEKGYLGGYPDGRYLPKANVTRAEFASLLVRLSTNKPETAAAAGFTDVAGHWSEQAVSQAVALGFIEPKDYSGGFKPNIAITRYEMAKWMADGLAKKEPSFGQAMKDSQQTLLPISEQFKGGIESSQYPAVAVAMGTKLMSGYPDASFGLNKPTNRAEVAIIANRYAEVSKKKAEDFLWLNELREVGLTGTNITSLTPYEYGKGTGDFSRVRGTKIPLKYNRGVMWYNHFIVTDALNDKVYRGIYDPMFHGERDNRAYKDTYMVYADISYVPNVDDFNYKMFDPEPHTDLFPGSRIASGNHKKYGYKTIHRSWTEIKFEKGKETRLWLEIPIIKHQNNEKDFTTYDTIPAGKDTWVQLWLMKPDKISKK